MSKGNALEAQVIALLFNDTALPWSVASLYVAAHTADPGEGGDQTTSEATFTGYARVAVSQDAGGWTVAGNQASNTAEITFPECTGGSNTVTHFSVGLAASGASQILYFGELDDPLNISNLITLRFPAGALVCQED